MQTILLTDDNGYFPIADYPTNGGTFVRQPLPVVLTDIHGYKVGTRIYSKGGTSAYKYYYTLVGLPGAGINYVVSCWVYNQGPSAVTVGSNYGNTAPLAPGSFGLLSFPLTSNGVSGIQLLFYAANSTDDMDIVAYNPVIAKVSDGINQIPWNQRTFTNGNWVAGTGNTVTLTQGFKTPVFTRGPLGLKQVTNIPGTFTDANGSQTEAPFACVQTDELGYSLWSGKFIAGPLSVVLDHNPPRPAVIQSAASTNVGNVQTCAIPAFASNVTQDNRIIVTVSYGATGGVTVQSIIDQNGIALTKVAANTASGFGAQVEIWSGTYPLAGQKPQFTVTLTSAATNAYFGAAAIEVSGVDAPDKGSIGTYTQAGVSASPIGTASLSQPVELVVCCFVNNGGGAASVGTGWTLISNVTGAAMQYVLSRFNTQSTQSIDVGLNGTQSQNVGVWAAFPASD